MNETVVFVLALNQGSPIVSKLKIVHEGFGRSDMSYAVTLSCPMCKLVSREPTPDDAYQQATKWLRNSDDVPSEVTIETPDGRLLRDGSLHKVYNKAVAMIASDPDWAEFEPIDWSKMELVIPPKKQAISIRLDQDLIDYFKA